MEEYTIIVLGFCLKGNAYILFLSLVTLIYCNKNKTVTFFLTFKSNKIKREIGWSKLISYRLIPCSQSPNWCSSRQYRRTCDGAVNEFVYANVLEGFLKHSKATIREKTKNIEIHQSFNVVKSSNEKIKIN